MFNNYRSGDQNVKVSNNLQINATSGGIYKTYRESWFKRFHLKSTLMEALSNFSNITYSEKFNEYRTEYPKEDAKPITVLQMVICGDMEVIAEIIYQEDLDKHLLGENIINE